MSQITIRTLAQLSANDPAALQLMHVEEDHLLLWITRGQGVLTLDGQRRGFGTHNAIFVPAGHIWSIDLGRHSLGQVVRIPAGAAPALAEFPQMPQQLRIQDGLLQAELTGLLDDMSREQQQSRPFFEDALCAQAGLIAIWLKRQLALLPAAKKPSASVRLMTRFSALAAQEYDSGASMADLAAKLGVTPTHLTRVCKQSSGLTAAQILTQCLTVAARKKLQREQTSFKQISETLGFASPAYFTRFMQQHCKATPTEIRRKSKALQPV
ncbi:AraC family transcriptional regulator [Cognatishimia sp. SS12]|uniref:helix-turn-helix domain-containing protein n=1 Tax=Cognatishimia sp. SS12 TaxID=2979465 RepID=UPI00232B6ABB|nr:AraC family transcriptional regulator [Cognatishimia sp. SS12]MDC0737059.1 AraC family transcriptional regulator [Cognatishimia sp. SS12]